MVEVWERECSGPEATDQIFQNPVNLILQRVDLLFNPAIPVTGIFRSGWLCRRRRRRGRKNDEGEVEAPKRPCTLAQRP